MVDDSIDKVLAKTVETRKKQRDLLTGTITVEGIVCMRTNMTDVPYPVAAVSGPPGAASAYTSAPAAKKGGDGKGNRNRTDAEPLPEAAGTPRPPTTADVELTFETAEADAAEALELHGIPPSEVRASLRARAVHLFLEKDVQPWMAAVHGCGGELPKSERRGALDIKDLRLENLWTEIAKNYFNNSEWNPVNVQTDDRVLKLEPHHAPTPSERLNNVALRALVNSQRTQYTLARDRYHRSGKGLEGAGEGNDDFWYRYAKGDVVLYYQHITHGDEAPGYCTKDMPTAGQFDIGAGVDDDDVGDDDQAFADVLAIPAPPNNNSSSSSSSCAAGKGGGNKNHKSKAPGKRKVIEVCREDVVDLSGDAQSDAEAAAATAAAAVATAERDGSISRYYETQNATLRLQTMESLLNSPVFRNGAEPGTLAAAEAAYMEAAMRVFA
jgi:hypothetical protein